MSRALVIANQEDPESGFVGERMEQRGIEMVRCWRDDAQVAGVDLGGFDFVVALGSLWSVYDPALADLIEPELDLLRRGVERDVPILAICFGAQALAAALGGSVGAAVRPELGWTTVETNDAGRIPPGPWMQWHNDSFTLPPGATELARNSFGVQAFSVGRSLAVQFHPEADDDMVTRWCQGGAKYLAEHGLDGGAIVADTARNTPRSRLTAHRLFDYFCDDIGG